MVVFIFDFDGVLNEESYEDLVGACAKNSSWRKGKILKFIKEQELKYSGRKSDAQFWKVLHKTFKPDKTTKELEILLNHNRLLSTWALSKKLAKKNEMYLFSNQVSSRKKHLLKKFDFSHFRKTFFSSDMEMVKPSKESFLYVLKRIGKKPGECVFVDDREINIIAAKKLGIDVIFYKGNPAILAKFLK